MNKTVLITGASRGIGRETALAFCRAGYRVAANYHTSEEAAAQLKRQIQQEGGDCLLVQADISVYQEAENIFSAVQNAFGGVDVLVNNAAIAQQKMFCDITGQDWQRMFGVCVTGMFHCSQLALPYMVHQKTGRIINIGSVWGQTGASCEVHYSAAKAAVAGFTKALAKELGPSGVTVNCVAPGVIDTQMNAHLQPEEMSSLCEQTPLCRIGSPAEVAEAVLFLASEKAAFITGQVLGVDGGFGV